MYINNKSQFIKDLMVKSGTYFGYNYARVMKEHPAADEKAHVTRIIDTVSTRQFDLKKLVEMYFSDNDLKDAIVPF